MADIANSVNEQSPKEDSQEEPHSPVVSSRPGFKTYSFYQTWRQNIKVCDEAKNTVYFSKFSSMTSAPDLVLHRGSDSEAPVVTVAHFRWSRHVTIGFGDPAVDEVDMRWEDMKNVSGGIGHSKYQVEMLEKDGERRSFLWQRTRALADGVQGVGGLIRWNYKLVAESTGEILAVYLDNFIASLGKGGKLRVRVDLSADLELMALSGSLALWEKGKRGGRH